MKIIACAVAVSALLFTGCASDGEEKRTSEEYQARTAKTVTYKCQPGYVLRCEAKRTGRIRFGRIGNQDLESCACEPDTGMPVQSPLPGIY